MSGKHIAESCLSVSPHFKGICAYRPSWLDYYDTWYVYVVHFYMLCHLVIQCIMPLCNHHNLPWFIMIKSLNFPFWWRCIIEQNIIIRLLNIWYRDQMKTKLWRNNTGWKYEVRKLICSEIQFIPFTRHMYHDNNIYHVS